MRDRPPPSTMTSGSSRLMTPASARARRCAVALQVAWHAASPAAARVAMVWPRPGCRRACGVVACDARAADQGFHAAALAAVTGPRRVFTGLAPGQRVVAPFAGQAVGAAAARGRARRCPHRCRCPGWRQTPRPRRRPAPSVASLSARQLASLASCTRAGRWRPARRAAAACRSGRWSCSSSSARRRLAAGRADAHGEGLARRRPGALRPPGRRSPAPWRCSCRRAWPRAGARPRPGRWPSNSTASVLVPPRSMPRAQGFKARRALVQPGQRSTAPPAAPGVRARWRGRC
jgi:hypothetical protein